MWRSIVFALLICVLLSNTSFAVVSIASTRVPTIGLSGFITETLTATASAGEKLIGFDFVSASDNYGFFGAMSQVNPAGLPTVFKDAFDLILFPFPFPPPDSYFLVKSTDGIALLPSESANSLKAAFNFSPVGVAAASDVWTFVQIVHAAPVEYRGTLTVRDALGVERLEYISGVLPAVPEPTTLALVALPLFGGYGWIRGRSRPNRR